jgi:hypothetical protein
VRLFLVSLRVFVCTLSGYMAVGKCQTEMVKRERAVELAEHVLRNLHEGQGVWPLSLVTEVYMFGSFARGALSPHDLDIDVEHARDHQWGGHIATSLAYGRDPYSPMRRMLISGKRGCQFTFQFREQADFELTLLWRRGDGLATALERLHAIKADPTAGRAVRDSMLPEFEGLDDWIPRPYREALCAAVSNGAIGLERMLLPDSPVVSEVAAEHLGYRWKPLSPLYRAACAVVHYWEDRGIDPGHCHLHGADIRDKETPYFAGFGWRYFRSIPACLTRFDGAEWIEVVHPTRTRPLDCLRIVPLDRQGLGQALWD